MGIIAAIIGSVAVFITAIGTAIKTRLNVVESGHLGVKFRLGKAVTTWKINPQTGDYVRDQDCNRIRTVRLYAEGFVFQVPLFHRLKQMRTKEHNTDHEPIANQRPFTYGQNVSLVTLGQVILTYDMADEGIVMALKVVGDEASYRALIQQDFFNLCGDVMRDNDRTIGRGELRAELMRVVSGSPAITRYGIIVRNITLPDLADSPATQQALAVQAITGSLDRLSTALEAAVKHSLLVQNGHDAAAPHVVTQNGHASVSSNGHGASSNGNGHHPASTY